MTSILDFHSPVSEIPLLPRNWGFFICAFKGPVCGRSENSGRRALILAQEIIGEQTPAVCKLSHSPRGFRSVDNREARHGFNFCGWLKDFCVAR